MRGIIPVGLDYPLGIAAECMASDLNGDGYVNAEGYCLG
jgi:hypothetical protein